MKAAQKRPRVEPRRVREPRGAAHEEEVAIVSNGDSRSKKRGLVTLKKTLVLILGESRVKKTPWSNL